MYSLVDGGGWILQLKSGSGEPLNFLSSSDSGTEVELIVGFRRRVLCVRSCDTSSDKQQSSYVEVRWISVVSGESENLVTHV